MQNMHADQGAMSSRSSLPRLRTRALKPSKTLHRRYNSIPIPTLKYDKDEKTEDDTPDAQQWKIHYFPLFEFDTVSVLVVSHW